MKVNVGKYFNVINVKCALFCSKALSFSNQHVKVFVLRSKLLCLKYAEVTVAFVQFTLTDVILYAYVRNHREIE